VSGVGPEVVLLLGPLVLIEIVLVVWALYDLTRPGRRVRGESRLMWALIILLVSTIGPILYFLVGRQEGTAEPEAPPVWPTAVAPEPSAAQPGPAAGAAAASAAPAAPVAAPAAPVTEPSAPVGTAASPIPVPPAPPTLPTGGVAGVPAAIACHGLSKRYPGGVLALDRLDMEVPSGSVFGLLGPNGAGKTTTLRLLVGLARPTAGSATVAGIPLGATELNERIGFLDQDPRYYGWATGRELVALVGRLARMTGPTLDRRVDEVIDRVGLADAADRRIGTYSGGMRQRLGIAQALVAHPPVLILDEPVSSLDPEGRRDLLALIAELRDSATVLFSTHVLADVERICDRIAILDHGRLVTEGPLGALLDRYALPIYRVEPEPGQAEAVARLAAALRTTGWASDVAVEHGSVRVTVSDPSRASRELLPAIVAAELAVSGVERVRPTLEDVFLQLTGSAGRVA
jgi:ABC-2 type transport system ATP-binding protein